MANSFFLLLVVALQQDTAARPPTDSVYATAHVKSLVTRAAGANRRIPERLGSYRARVETELSIVMVDAHGRERVSQIEQVASDVFWRRDGALLQEIVGFRTQAIFVPLYSLAGMLMDIPSIVPSLYGERLDLVRAGKRPTREERHAVHPFSERREAVYRYAGGDTAQIIRTAQREIPIVRIRVRPRGPSATPMLVFDGEIYLDAVRMQIVRLEGRLIPAGPDPPVNDNVVQANMYVRFATAEYDQSYWLPSEQHWEMQLAPVMFTESRAVVRTITRFFDVHPNDSTAGRRAVPVDSYGHGQLAGLRDQRRLSRFSDWRTPIGELTTRANAHEFDPYAPRRRGRDDARAADVRAEGAPRLSFGTRYASQIVRYNDVEGLYTGAGVRLSLGSLAPGLTIRAHAGWAWQEETARGGAEVAEQHGAWEFVARGERLLAQTNDLSSVDVPEPGVPPLIGDDRFFDRRIGGLIARTVRGQGVAWRFEVARAGDRLAGRDVAPLTEPLPDTAAGSADEVSLTRVISEGDFWLSRAEVRSTVSAGGLSLHRGVRIRLAFEQAAGSLDWRRLELGASVRHVLGRWTFAVNADAGAVSSPSIAPQALFQIRSVGDLSAVRDRAFTGDRAAITQASVSYTFPLYGAPVRTFGWWLPAPAPTVYVRGRLGWTDATAETREVMDRFGWRTSSGSRASIATGLSFFGGGIGVGAARPLYHDGEWRFVVRGSIGG